MLVSCAKAPEAALLPLPKQVEYTGGSVKADAPVTETLPEVGDSFTLRGYQFTVMEMDGFRVTRMQVAKLPSEEPEEAAEEEKPETEPEAEVPEEDKETKH